MLPFLKVTSAGSTSAIPTSACAATQAWPARTHSSCCAKRGWQRASSRAMCGGSRTDHSTPTSSSAGVAAGRWPPGMEGPAASGVLAPAAATAAAPPPASCISACCRASLLASSAPLSCCSEVCVALLLPPLTASLPPGCWLLQLAAAEAAGRCREASALTMRQRCCLPARSDCSTQAGDTMPTPAQHRQGRG